MPELLFDEINGTAEDIRSWQNLIWGSKPEFHHVGMPTADRSFTASLSRTVLDRVSTHRIRASTRKHAVRRTAEHIRHTAEPNYVMVFQLAGRSEFQQGDSHAVLSPGDLTIARSGTPYSWLHPGDFEVYMLILPQALIDAPPRSMQRLAASPIRADGPFGQCLTGFVEALAHDEEALRGPFGHRAMRNLVEVVSTRLIAEIDATVPQQDQPSLALFRRLTDHISENLGDPELTPASVARSNHVSLRYAQAIFQHYGASMAAWVRERRLSRVREDLGDPAQDHRGIGVIASSWGLTDQAAFSRSFRLAFGESPSQWRARAREGR